MKQKLIAFVLVLTALLTCSCSREREESIIDKITSSVLSEGEIETGTIAGDYIFRYVQEGSQQLLLKYHIPTGTVTTVCQDPFCAHEFTCPFAIGASRFAAIGDILYYVQEGEKQNEIRSYNGDDMQIKQVYTSDGVLGNLFTYNYYLYFTDVKPGEKTEFIATVYRLDTQTNKILEINTTTESDKIYKIKDNKIIWRKGSDYHSTDLNGNFLKKIKREDKQWGNYTYRTEINVEGQLTWENFKLDLYRTNISTGEEKLVAKDIGFFYFYGERIIYFKSTGKKTLINTFDGLNWYDYFGGNVYVMNLDGSDSRLLCHVDNCSINSLSTNRNNELICGDWIGIIAENYYEDQYGNVSLLLSDLLLVNVITGEYRYAAYNPYE